MVDTFKPLARKQTTSARHFTPLKHKAEAAGLAYSSVRDAAFRGELPVLKIGTNPNHQRWYVDDREWDRWVESRMEVCV